MVGNNFPWPEGAGEADGTQGTGRTQGTGAAVEGAASETAGAFTLRTDAYPGAVLAYHLTRAK